MKIISIKNISSKDLSFGASFEILSYDSIAIENLKDLQEHLQSLEDAYKYNQIEFIVDVNTKATFEEFEEFLNENKFINNEPNLLSDVKNENCEELEEEVIKLQELLNNKQNEYDDIFNLMEVVKEDNILLSSNVMSLKKLISYELEDEEISSDDLILYAKVNNIDIGKKTNKEKILEVINEQFKENS